MADRPSRSTFHERMDEMVSVLRDEMISGKRQVGEFLPSERALGKQFRISNKSVRDALGILQSEGLIEKIPKVGSRVASLPDDKAIRVRFAYHNELVHECDISHLITMFHKEHPHIRVQPMPLMDFTEFMDSDLFDVFSVNHIGFQQIVKEGLTHRLETQQPRENVYPYLFKSFLYEGELKVQPFTFSPVILCYNKAHFAEKNVLEPDSSWSWDDLIRAAAQLEIPNERFGFYTYLQAINRWPTLLLQSGLAFPKPGDRSYVERLGTWVEALRICRDLIRQQSMKTIFDREEDTEELFLQGRASMIMTTYFRLNELKKAPFEYDIAPLPYSHNSKTQLITIGLGLMAGSKQKEASKAFIDFLLSYTSQQTIRSRTLSIPALKTAAEWNGKDSVHRPSRFPMHREIVPTFGLISELNMNERMISSLLKEAKYYWSGLYSDDALQDRLEAWIEDQLEEQRQQQLAAAE